jgi:excinuclease ABC subunit B
MSNQFKLEAPYPPAGDQPGAIDGLRRGLAAGRRFQTLEGVTGSGKTFAIANVIASAGVPVLVISHNKTLAAQLYDEFKGFFPSNAVEYFVSYYDYYQPEAYIPQTDTYIEKDASINEEIERFRLSATNSLLSRRDVIVVGSVSCIYGLGSPEDYAGMLVDVAVGAEVARDSVLRRLIDIQYDRNDYEQRPGVFRVRGEVVDVFPSYERDTAIRLEFSGDKVERIRRLDPVSGKATGDMQRALISPARHFVMPESKIEPAIGRILDELKERVAWFEKQGKLLEAQRIRQRTLYDMEMLREIGYCSGIENYSRHLGGRNAGEPPATLINYFPGDFLTIIDESHVTLPQLRGMYNGDQARKQVLVEHGFRLPSAKDNRPLNFDEFLAAVGRVIFTTATPGPFELEHGGETVKQIIRPTGLVDPPVEVRPMKHQVDDLMETVRQRAEDSERSLVTTLTKRTAEDLSAYLREAGLRVEYLHSDIDAIERVNILRRLRKGEFDCLIGVNLLREGLDLPEVSLVAILDADKEGFLRSERSLIQVAGRTARHVNGRVILYADTVTDSMRRMIEITGERRTRQLEYNAEHGIVPRSTQRRIGEGLAEEQAVPEALDRMVVKESGVEYDIHETLQAVEREMIEAAEALEFERAAILRDEMLELKRQAGLSVPRTGKKVPTKSAAKGTAYPRATPVRRAMKGKHFESK